MATQLNCEYKLMAQTGDLADVLIQNSVCPGFLRDELSEVMGGFVTVASDIIWRFCNEEEERTFKDYMAVYSFNTYQAFAKV